MPRPPLSVPQERGVAMTALATMGTSGTSPTFEKLRHHFEIFGFRCVRIESVEDIGALPRNYVVVRKASTAARREYPASGLKRIPGAARMAVRT